MTSSTKMWATLREEAAARKEREPVLGGMLAAAILDRRTLAEALAARLAQELATPDLDATRLREIFSGCYAADATLIKVAAKDCATVTERDPAATSPLLPFLFFKWFQALQTYRLAHHLWGQGRDTLALYLQAWSSRRFGVDIHPAALIGQGIMLDHAHG